jgi:hypothetical protein
LKTKNGEEEDADGEENGEEEDATGTDQRRTARVSRDGAAAEQKHRLCFSVFHFLFLIFFCFF